MPVTVFAANRSSPQRWQDSSRVGTAPIGSQHRIPTPVRGSRAGRQFINKAGNLRGKKVQSLISQLSSPSASYRKQYFVLSERRGGLVPGIWRRYRAKDTVSLAFALLDQKPTQDTRIDIHGLLLEEAEQRSSIPN